MARKRVRQEGPSQELRLLWWQYLAMLLSMAYKVLGGTVLRCLNMLRTIFCIFFSIDPPLLCLKWLGRC